MQKADFWELILLLQPVRVCFRGYSFAIPVNLVTRIADDIIEFGSFQRAFLGG